MAVNLNRAPLVIPKNKRTNIRFQGKPLGKRDTLVFEMNKQSLSDIQYIMKVITIEDTEAEIKKDNEPTRLAVDGREGKSLIYAVRKTEVTFGNFLDLLLIKTIQQVMMSAIKAYAATPAQAGLGNMSRWQWVYAEKAGQQATPVQIRNVKSLPYGSYLILKPNNPKTGVADMHAARKDIGWPERKWNMPGRSDGVGFMAKGVAALKRTRLMKNYTIHVVFTQKFKVPNEEYSHGTPVVVLRARRNRGYKRPKVRI